MQKLQKKFNNSLFIFRRDLRLEDNTALIQASRESNNVVPCFIIDPRQVEATNNYRSLNAIQFMKETLLDLDEHIRSEGGRLYILQGTADKIITHIIKTVPIDALYTNRDYTPFSEHRDEALKKICYEHDIEFIQKNDLLLTEPEDIVTGNGTPYSIFTPFFKRARQKTIEQPDLYRISNWYTKPLKGALQNIKQAFEPYENEQLHVYGSIKNAKQILRSMKKFESYGLTHDYPAIPTTNLSAFTKFGLVSIRRIYHTMLNSLGPSNPLIRQLYWRDFFTHIAYFSPFVFGQPFKERYKKLEWRNDMHQFEAWCQGLTGFPIIDAGMRQLNETGYMHNRVRLLVSSFLVKDLHIDWRLGEQYFAQKLVDYDPAVNNGNWQWVASTGTDAQPYFRIFNPWLQQKKFDADCTYIKHWVPELATISPAIIHNLYKTRPSHTIKYPLPLVDHSVESLISKMLYKKATNNDI
jgi:deoxyribodipyrimidine photo-lyase